MLAVVALVLLALGAAMVLSGLAHQTIAEWVQGALR